MRARPSRSPVPGSRARCRSGQTLLTELRANLDTAEVRLSEPLQPLAGGYSNEIARFRLEGAPPPFDQPLVLRVTHDPRETAREAIIEDGVAAFGHPAPAVFLRGGPSSALGAPFLITALSPGVAFDDTITGRNAIGAFRRLPHQLATTMADLHNLPTAAIASRLAAEGWPADQLDSLAVLAEVADLARQLPGPARDLVRDWDWGRTAAAAARPAIKAPSTWCSNPGRASGNGRVSESGACT